MQRFRDYLKAKQGTKPDREIAAQLGISRAHWSHIKHGGRPITLSVLNAAIALWPDLGPVYLEEVQRITESLAADEVA